MELLYNCEQVAERYGVKISTVWSWIRDRKLKAVKIGKSYRVRESDMVAFEEKNSTKEEPCNVFDR